MIGLEELAYQANPGDSMILLMNLSGPHLANGQTTEPERRRQEMR